VNAKASVTVSDPVRLEMPKGLALMPGKLLRKPLMLLMLAAPACLSPAPPAGAVSFHVETAPEWNELFERRRGWTGADGAFSIPLGGVYTPGSFELQPTIFSFGDTFVGEIDEFERRLPGGFMINNTFSAIGEFQDDPGPMRFFYPADHQGNPRSVFIPDTPNAEEGDWYWPGDGYVNQAMDSDLYIFHYRLRHPMNLAGVSLVILRAGSSNPYKEHEQIETPLFRPGDDLREPIGLGNSLIVNTRWAGAPSPDGFVYVYGHEEGLRKNLLVSRIRPEAMENPEAWRFWNGTEWTGDISESAPLFSAITGNIALELLSDGRVIALFMDFSGHIRARIGEGFTGPFSPPYIVYRTPEVDFDPDIITYGAVAHSHLSRPGELLINYSVNSLDFFKLWENCYWYLPKFIRVTISE